MNKFDEELKNIKIDVDLRTIKINNIEEDLKNTKKRLDDIKTQLNLLIVKVNKMNYISSYSSSANSDTESNDSDDIKGLYDSDIE